MALENVVKKRLNIRHDTLRIDSDSRIGDDLEKGYGKRLEDVAERRSFGQNIGLMAPARVAALMST